MVSNLADIHFAPTKGAANNLLQENKSPDSILLLEILLSTHSN